ncbi:hypothetical protein C2845_PM08G20420 [Panicum miliaceum]|uniref:Uncharacterized protein n=1 Tax=Panicum miliaceum TaxID=4540 RepID=A0A3L6R180_PANMI|nr:hypothetical protein C2845_PM08G20420 [Panicum miliaceum]
MDHIKLIVRSHFLSLHQSSCCHERHSETQWRPPRAERTKLQRHVRPPFVGSTTPPPGQLRNIAVDGTAAVGNTCAYTSSQKTEPMA